MAPLERLETQTKRELADILARGGVPVRERTLDVRLGQMVGAVVAALPWRLMLRGLGVVTEHSVKFWQRLERLGPPEDARFLASLTAHERAQYDFVRRELRGDADSLEPVRVLLST